MSNYILDACAMVALMRQEPGWVEIQKIADDTNNVCFTHAINLCEVFYDYRRTDGEELAVNITQDLIDIGLVVREDMDSSFWQQAGRIKSDYRRISLADCFCLALAQRLGGTVVTSDHHEMDIIEQDKLVPVKFFR